MRRSMLVLALSAVGLLMAARPMDAHHSWQLDRSKQVELKGTVTKFDFGNPHVQIYLQVKEDNGATGNWMVGGPSPNQLSRSGWTRDIVKPGDQITAAGYRNKDGSNVMRFDTITLAGGQVMVGYRGR
jgi:hypothetical protein